MKRASAGILLAALLAACANQTVSVPRLCSRAAYWDGLRTLPAYREALKATFPEVDPQRGVCLPDKADPGSVHRCVVFDRLNQLERHCYAERKAAE